MAQALASEQHRPRHPRRRRSRDFNESAHLQHALACTGGLFAAGARAGADVRVRHDRLRPTATSAMRAPWWPSTSCSRWLEASGYAVTFVRNITDIDDKIIRRAVENGETDPPAHRPHDRRPCTRTSTRSASRRPTHEPRATDYVPQMLDDRRTLERKGLAYRAERRRQLRGAQLPRLRQAVRQDRSTNCTPASAWRCSKARKTRSTSCCGRPPSRRAGRRASGRVAYGPGRPGWHIECSAMSLRAAGRDTSTSTAAAPTCSSRTTRTRSPRAKAPTACRWRTCWMHNGFVNIDNEKMSKSLGNFFTIRDVLQKLRRRDAALLHRARALPQPAQLQRRAPGRRARRA